MKKKNLIFDLDDTLFKSRQVLIVYMNKTWGIQSQESDYTTQDTLHLIVQKYLNDPSVTREQVYGHYWKNFSYSDYWHSKLFPMPHMPEVVFGLVKKYNLSIATRRSNQSEVQVNKLLNTFIPNCISSVYFATKTNDGINYVYQRKRDFILGLNGESIAYFDDSPMEIEQTEDIIDSFLFDPNDEHPLRQMMKMRSWLEIGNRYL